MPKWIPPLLILFVVFFILNNPSEAGPQTRSFFGWIGAQASNAGTFLDGLFGDEADPANPDVTNNGTQAPNPPADGAGSGQDSFNTMGSVTVNMNSATYTVTATL